MEDLKSQLEQLGIDPSKCQGVIDTVLQFIKDKLPENLHGLIDGALHGEGGASSLLDQAKGILGGFLK